MGFNHLGYLICSALAAALLYSGPAWADALCNYDDKTQMEAYLGKGREAERAGRSLDAILFYRLVGFCGDESEARDGIKRIGVRYAQKAAQKGNLFTSTGIIEYVHDAGCRRWTQNNYLIPNPYDPPVPGMCIMASGGMKAQLNESAGAFNWYNETGSYREADAMMLKWASVSPEEMDVYRIAFNHFEARKNFDSRVYKPDPAHLSEMRKIALSNVETTLKREEQEFSRNALPRPIPLIEHAIRWANFASSSRTMVLVRAEERGDETFIDDPSPQGLADALAYYSIAGSRYKKKAVLDKADESGYSALKNNDPAAALRYFTVSGNADWIEKARLTLKEQKKVQ